MITEIKNISLSYFFKNKSELFLNKKNFIALLVFEDINLFKSLKIKKIIKEIYQFNKFEVEKYFISAFKKIIKKNKDLDYKYFLILDQRNNIDENLLYFNSKTKEEFEKLLNELNNTKYNIIIYNIFLDEKYLKENTFKIKKIKI